MALFEGKKGLIIGVANDHSIAWVIAQKIMEQGGECGFTHLPDRSDDKRQRNRHRVSLLTDKYEQAKFLIPMDVADDDNIASAIGHTADTFGKIDFLLHSVAFASVDDLKGETIDTSRDGFKMAMEISAYSLLAVARASQHIFNPGGGILTMTYFGGEKAVPGYNVMGICKAALDAIVKYLAFDLGPKDIRINALSAGPLRTLAARGAGVDGMQKLYEQMSPLMRNITHDEVGNTGAFMLSDLSTGITGEILHIDGGYNAMGSPGRMLEPFKLDKD